MGNKSEGKGGETIIATAGSWEKSEGQKVGSQVHATAPTSIAQAAVAVEARHEGQRKSGEERR